MNAFTGDSAATINGLESDLPDVAVKHTDTGLGGHLGPDDGFTAPHIPRAVDQNHDWFQANPEWWVTPEPERGDVKPMIRIHGSVYPVEVLAFVATVKNAVASDYVQAA